MTVNAITDTKKGRTGIAPTYLHTTLSIHQLYVYCAKFHAHGSYRVRTLIVGRMG